MIHSFLKHLKQQRRIATSSFAALVIGTMAMLPMAASAASPTTAIKARPAAPATAQTTLAAPNPAKSQATRDVTPALAYTATLSASSTSLWPTQYTTLTAGTNQDVGPTPYYLSIYDATAGSYVKICGFGTTCVVSVTQATATTHTYRSYVSLYPYTNPPAGQQAVSPNVYVTWKSISVTSLYASPSTLGVNGTTALTATTSTDVLPTPFYTEIFDINTGARIAVCGGGTSCTGYTSQAVATTHKFVAYVANYSAPVTGVQATSYPTYVTWTSGNYRVSITASYSSPGYSLVTAYSNINVGPTPYYIQIFNLNTGARVAVCGSGVTCSVNTALAYGQNNFVAFISSYSTTIPPLNTQANSNGVLQYYYPFIRP